MKYYILRLLQNGNSEMLEVSMHRLDDELQCWQLEEVYPANKYIIFVMSDSETSGHRS